MSNNKDKPVPLTKQLKKILRQIFDPTEIERITIKEIKKQRGKETRKAVLQAANEKVLAKLTKSKDKIMKFATQSDKDRQTDLNLAEMVTEERTVPRTVNLDVRVLDDDKYQTVLNDIRRSRAVKAKLASIFLNAHTAGAAIEYDKNGYLTIRDDDQQATTILKEMYKHKSGPNLYSLKPYINELLPNWMCCIIDDLRADVETVWKTKDPRLKKRRIQLALEGRRRSPVFAFQGIKFNSNASVKYDGITITLKWSKDTGPITFQLLGKKKRGDRRSKIDKGRYIKWKQIVEGNIKTGTITLNERDGKLRLYIPYYEKASDSLDPTKKLRVNFSEDKAQMVQCSVRNTLIDETNEPTLIDLYRNEQISSLEALSAIDRLGIQKEKYDAQRRSCGYVGKARKASTKKLNKITKQRANVTDYWNHLWSKNIVKISERWNCGQIELLNVPNDLFGRSWPWADFTNKVTHKADKIGIKVTVPKTTQVSDLLTVGT